MIRDARPLPKPGVRAGAAARVGPARRRGQSCGARSGSLQTASAAVTAAATSTTLRATTTATGPDSRATIRQ